jgi:hypothetical protein
VGEEQSSRV